MERTAIAVCTYLRNDGLRRLLAAVDQLRIPESEERQVAVIVVDNSPDGGARDCVYENAANARFEIIYLSETDKGLSNARNAALATARASGAKYLAFIDDDEVPEPGWLHALRAAMERDGAAAAAGPTYPVFARPPGSWLPVARYDYVPAVKNGYALDGSSANLMLDLEKLADSGIEFDARFNETGGEDTCLVKELMRRGHKIAWASDAIVWDDIPANRMTVRWLMRRWYRTGQTEARLSASNPYSPSARAVNVAKGFVRLAGGTAKAVVRLPQIARGKPYRFVDSFFTICRGGGYLAGAFGRAYREYSANGYRQR